jgi:hypothetical protein
VVSLVQPNFSSGELTPLAHGRTDLNRYGTGLRQARNWIIRPHGCLMNRPGTVFDSRTKYSGSQRSRLVPFVFSNTQAYMLEFSAGAIRVYQNGVKQSSASSPSATITNVQDGIVGFSIRRTITLAAPPTTPINVGDTIDISGVVATGSYDVNGSWEVLGLSGSTTIYIDGSGDPTGSYTSGGVIAGPIEISNPYIESDLPNLQYAQSADVLTVTLQRLPQHELRRTSLSPLTFTFTQANYTDGPFLTQNTDISVTVTASAVSGSITLTASSGIFSASHVGGLFRLEQENVDDVAPWEPTKVIAVGAASPVGLLRRNDGKTYECTAPIPPGGTVNTATGSIPPTHDSGTAKDGDGNKIASFADISGVSWLYLDSGFGIVQITGFASPTEVTGTVVRRLPATVTTHASSLWSFGAWSPAQGYPATVTYFQDRLFFGGTTGQPQGVWSSKTGQYSNFGTSVPSQDDDALTFFLNARQINAITDLIALESLLAVTSNAVWRVTSGTDEVLTPSTVGFKPQNYIGGLPTVRSETVGDSAIYPQTDGRRVRDLLFDFQFDKFTGNELSLLAEHLFPPGTAITRISYAQYPFSLVHHIRSDGGLPTLSYLRDQEVLGWSPWDTNGAIEDVCSIPEGAVTRTYLIVRRTVNGLTVRYIEHFADREFSAIEDAYFVDAGASYDGRNTSSVTMTLSGGVNWDTSESLTLTASATAGWADFAPEDVGNEIWLTSGSDRVRVRITARISSIVATVVPVSAVPASLQGVATADWSFAKTVISGLDHLEGEDVMILADGMDVDPQTVSGGAVTLAHPGAVVHAGLSYQSDLETLDFNVPGAPTVRGKTKTIPSVGVLMYASRGIFVGPDESHLDEIAQRLDENMDAPIDPYTGLALVPVGTRPNANGRMFLRQNRPLPATIIGILPDIEFGE